MIPSPDAPPTTQITAFLEARIAEDEAAVDLGGTFGAPDRGKWSEGAPQRWDYDLMHVGPSRWLAECEAKRRIVELHRMESDGIVTGCPLCDHNCNTGGDLSHDGPCHTLRALAAVYADHADYQPEWRP